MRSLIGRIDRLKFQVKIGTAGPLVLYTTLLAYLLSPDWVLANITVFRAIIWAAAIAFAGFLVIGNVHNLVDRLCFGEREKVDDYIRTRLTQPCKEALCPRAVKDGILDGERQPLMDLFYTFIPPDDTERERAFSYFRDYFVTVNLSILSILGSVGAVVMVAITPLVRRDQRLIFVAIALLLPALSNGLRLLTKRRLSLPAQAQTTRILADHLDLLKQRLPHYRIYTPGQACKDSGRCPFVGTRS